MRCVVTAGPTYEPLDDVRRLTNFSTGRLGSELAGFLTSRGHEVTLLIGEQATYSGERRAAKVDTFTTTTNLANQLKTLGGDDKAAVFHAAAVSDFGFGKIWSRSPGGALTELRSGKISTRQGTLLAELTPTVKIISELRQWYPNGFLVGWKFEVEGNRTEVIRLAERQLAECRTNVCVANGAAYGPGFGIVRPGGECRHTPDTRDLFATLDELLQSL